MNQFCNRDVFQRISDAATIAPLNQNSVVECFGMLAPSDAVSVALGVFPAV